MRLRPKILDMTPGTRVVSNTFTMEDWEPDEKATIPDCSQWCTALLWIVPAKVEGAWRLGQGQLSLPQQCQVVTGTYVTGTTNTPVTNGKLRGRDITFTAGTVQYSGRVNGNTMEGTSGSGAANKWQATRAAR